MKYNYQAFKYFFYITRVKGNEAYLSVYAGQTRFLYGNCPEHL
ncbi:hypothetical protein B0I18_102187 [Taibaiella chishuiensis]|uniref:Uncharacterized protein n=1 Tax=Taibaiella chishuiensis TaxID=1434707 RepID=A0A2P8D7P3_9BACT|nr:hypothetical protein B0I18_102187 [Taibaiella chishuiensis]